MDLRTDGTKKYTSSEHGNNDRIATVLQKSMGFVCGNAVAVRKTLRQPHGRGNASERRMCNSSPYMAPVFGFQSDLGFVMLEDSRRIQVITRVVQGIDHYSSTYGDALYVRITLDT